MGSGKVATFGILTTVLIAACSSGAPSDRPASSPIPPSGALASAPASVAPSVAAPSKAAPNEPIGIVVLTSGSDGGLWTVTPAGTWTKARNLAGASAIAASKDGVAVASTEQIRVLTGPNLADGPQTALTWPSGAAKAISSFAMSDDGRAALVVATGSDVGYAVADAQGRVGPVEVPASQPFTPIVAWLGADRRLLLGTDTKQASRLVVEDASNRVTALTGLVGCRWFGVSGDGKTIAALTEDALYADTADSFLANAQPQKAVAIADGTVAWAVALSRDGTQIAFLSGHLAEDGSVSDVHDQILRKSAAGWQQTLDFKLPFSNVVGQAWAR